MMQVFEDSKVTDEYLSIFLNLDTYLNIECAAERNLAAPPSSRKGAPALSFDFTHLYIKACL